jgi:hypothetical protein
LEDEEKPWKPPKVGFGSAGLSAVVVVEGPPNILGVGFSVGAVVVMAGVACDDTPNGLDLVSPGLSVEVAAAGAPNAKADFCSGGLVAGVVLGCPNPVNPLPNVGLVSAGLSGVEVGAVVAAPKPNPNADLDSAGLPVVAAG